ncbi:MAG TPA: TetR/AcrR family transcriptional regulator [Gracilimonas sp.]|uniref:TetR/AcrR family transcriptional regulator n=1 Tax=Gracilimonas sp. TaxID=1974203 RepID=UPI002DAA3D33|nr:TetR/AcrR family transcriptional regulator [Gracilimonas sp.]
MSTKERKEREKKRRKDQILDATITLIEEQGFEQITMDEIASRAELSKGTLYLYYNDKATLYQAIKKKALVFLHEQFLKSIQQDMPGAMLVKDMVLTFLDLIQDNATFTKAMLLFEQISKDKPEEHSVIEDCTDLENELLMLIVRAIQIGNQDGSIKNKQSPKILALQIAIQMQGMLQFCIINANTKGAQILTEHEITLEGLMEQFLHTQFNYSE